jgi:hypothetical protein
LQIDGNGPGTIVIGDVVTLGTQQAAIGSAELGLRERIPHSKF